MSYRPRLIPAFIHTCRTVLLAALTMYVAGCSWTSVVSVNSAGEQGNNGSYTSAISANGRYVTFSSDASNLVPGDSNSTKDIFVRDTLTGSTVRVSVDSSGNEGGRFAYSSGPSISADGRYIAFTSAADFGVSTGATQHIYVHDQNGGTTTVVSVDSSGNSSGRQSDGASISSDGRYVAFCSESPNLVTGDTNSHDDIFVHDRTTGTTSRVSIDSAGNEANGPSEDPSISADGRYIAFASVADNLVAGDTNTQVDVFVHDRSTATTTRASVDSAGNQGDAFSAAPKISASGRYIAFIARASSLADYLTSGVQAFVHDSDTEITRLVSVDGNGNAGFGDVSRASMSADGRYIAYTSRARNLVPDDTNGLQDVFLYDQITESTSRVSVDALGAQADGDSIYPSISADGSYVVFSTAATNLVPSDVNGSRDIIIKAVRQLTATSVFPNMLPIGATTSVTVSGTNFLSGTGLHLKGGQFSNVVVVDENTITVDITIGAGESAGARNVSMFRLGTGPGALTGVSASCSNCVTLF